MNHSFQISVLISAFSAFSAVESSAGWKKHAIDMDNDGDLDILIAGHASNNVVWFENPLR